MKRLSSVQIFPKLSPGLLQLSLALSNFFLAVGDLFHVLADLLPAPRDFRAAGAAAYIPAQLGSVFSQLLIVLAQLATIFPNISSGFSDILDVLADFPFFRAAKFLVPFSPSIVAFTARMASSVIVAPTMPLLVSPFMLSRVEAFLRFFSRIK